MPKVEIPRANELLIQSGIERCLARIGRLSIRAENCAPWSSYPQAIEAEKRALRILEGTELCKEDAMRKGLAR